MAEFRAPINPEFMADYESSADLTTIEMEVMIMESDREKINAEHGQQGLAPLDVLPGDEAVVFYGARTPFLLRKVPGRDVFR
jgi:hypothetical protein